MKKLYLIAAFWLLNGIAFAQQETAFVGRTQASYDSIFSNLNFNQVTTGVLTDKTIILSNLEGYSGIGTPDTASIASWRQMYLEFLNASVDRSQILPLEEITSKVADFSVENLKFPLVMLAYNYNTFVPNAVEDGLLELDSINTHKVYDRSDGRPLYEQHRVFTAALPVHGWNNEIIPIYIGREFWFGNQEMPENLEINFGDGNGFISVEFDHTYEIAYEEGEHIITVRYALGDEEITANAKTKKDKPISVLPNIALGLVASREWPGERKATAIAWIKWGNGNTSGKFRKPLIFVEGIDFRTSRVPLGNQGCANYIIDNTGYLPISTFSFYTCGQTNLRNGEAGWNELVAYNEEYKSLEKMPKLREQLEQQGYDIVYLDFSDGAGLIQNNAMVLVELLEWINNPANRASGAQEAIALGASMGGQVSRFALHYMEQNSLCHNTRMYVSFDSPHRGANVPLGLQYMIADLASISSEAQEGVDNLSRPATKQMLVLHYSGDYTLRDAWQGWQNSPNSYPQNLRKIAVANGSRLMQPSSLYPGARIIETNMGGSIFGAGNKRCMALRGVSMYGHNNVIYRDGNGLFSKAVTKKADPSWPEYDSAPGCIARYPTALKQYWLTSWLFNIRQYECPFMPTISTLDVRAAYGNQNNLLDNVNLLYNITGNVINDRPDPTKYPFDAYFAPEVNEPHVQITDGLATNHPGRSNSVDENSYKPGPNNYFSNNIAWLMGQLQLLENSAPHPSQLPVPNTSPVISLHNFGSPLRNLLRPVTVQSGGELYVNKNAPVTGITPVFPAQPGTFQLKTIPGCLATVQVNTGGKFTLGDDTDTNYKATVLFKSNSILNLNGGKLVINDDSRLVIEEGATLLMTQNSVIELNGDNAILEINGTLDIAAGVTFTFTKAATQATSGFLRINMQSGRKMKVAQNSGFVLQGQGITDKIAEVTANSIINHDNWDIATYSIENGKIEMGLNAEWIMGNTGVIDNAHFTGAPNALYKTVTSTSKGDKIRNSIFTYAGHGVTLFQSTGDQSVLTGNQFNYNINGLRTFNGNVNLVNCSFANNTENGWLMHSGGHSSATGSNFTFNKKGILYNSATGSLNLISCNILDNVGLLNNLDSRGVEFVGNGILAGRCNLIERNNIGIMIKNDGFLNFSKQYNNDIMPANQLFNQYHNIQFEAGAGLNFLHGANYFDCGDGSNYYHTWTSNDGYTKGTSGISGTIRYDVIDNYNYPFYVGNNQFAGNYNRWNKASTAAAPVFGYEYQAESIRFDYSLYSPSTGPHGNNFAFQIIDNIPIGSNVQLPNCTVSNQRSAEVTTETQNGIANLNQTNNSSGCSQYQALSQAYAQAAGLRTQVNNSGNDYLGFTILKNALNAVQPDTCREFKALLVNSYRLMQSIYSASMVSDTSVAPAIKLSEVNQITNKFLLWKRQENDASGIYYITMDKAINGYTADNLSQARA